MPPTPRPLSPSQTPRRGVLYALLLVSLMPACGASLNALYEGDVRFEHCMSLDAQIEIKAKIRRACWEEWTKFYTFGQTRDRIEYAKHRLRQLNQMQGDDDVELLVVGPAATLAVPEPTSALAPPPMMLVTDAGSAPDSSDAAQDADAIEASVALPAAACTGACEAAFFECRSMCSKPRCESSCAVTYKRCMRKCF